MAADVPTREPAAVTAGDTFKFTRSEPDFLPADSWVLTYEIVKGDVQLTTITATDNGDGTHLVNVLPTVTDDWQPGVYRWQALVTKSTDRFQVGRGQLEVRTNFANEEAGFDGRSHAARMLDAIESLLEGKANRDAQSYSVAGRSLTRMTWQELREVRGSYRAEVAAEIAKLNRDEGRGTGRKVRAAFTS